MTRNEFIVLVWQMRHYQKSGQRELAQKAEVKVDEYLDRHFEQRLDFDETDYDGTPEYIQHFDPTC